MQLWSLKMADCVIKGRPALADKWAYDNGVVLKGLINVWRITNDYKYFDFCREFMDRFIYDGGLIRDYRPYDYNLDLIIMERFCLNFISRQKMINTKEQLLSLEDSFINIHAQAKEYFGIKKYILIKYGLMGYIWECLFI